MKGEEDGKRKRSSAGLSTISHPSRSINNIIPLSQSHSLANPKLLEHVVLASEGLVGN